MVSNSRWKYSFKEGRKAEQVFSDLMIERGATCVKSSKHDDIHKHIDFYVDGHGVDVKGNRHLDCIWLELINVRGKRGWLNGEADYVVFDVKELGAFCFFYREDLLEAVRGIHKIAKSKGEFYKLYTREGRLDVLVKVHYDYIKHLELSRVPYDG